MLTCTDDIPVINSASIIACPVDSSVKNTDLSSPFSVRQVLHILFRSNKLGSNLTTSSMAKLNYITNINTTKDAQTRKGNGENRFFHWSIVSKEYSIRIVSRSWKFGTHHPQQISKFTKYSNVSRRIRLLKQDIAKNDTNKCLFENESNFCTVSKVFFI
jgi:hypothetical protein